VTNCVLTGSVAGSKRVKDEASEAEGAIVVPSVVDATLGLMMIEPISKLAGTVEPVPCFQLNTPAAYDCPGKDAIEAFTVPLDVI
jgi:hypothetical protein